jgi:hypothetical protein
MPVDEITVALRSTLLATLLDPLIFCSRDFHVAGLAFKPGSDAAEMIATGLRS